MLLHETKQKKKKTGVWSSVRQDGTKCVHAQTKSTKVISWIKKKSLKVPTAITHSFSSRTLLHKEPTSHTHIYIYIVHCCVCTITQRSHVFHKDGNKGEPSAQSWRSAQLEVTCRFWLTFYQSICRSLLPPLVVSTD